MNQLITLSCPSCGASLEIPSGAERYFCKYCGNTHLRSGALPALSALDPHSIICPVEPHQDLIQKVSAIVQGQVFDASASTGSPFPVDRAPATPVTYISRLAQKLKCPARPGFVLQLLTTRGGLAFVIVSAIILCGLLGSAIVSLIFPRSDLCATLPLTMITAVIVVPAVTKYILFPIYSRKNAEYQDKRQQWLVAKNRWEKSYYCQRHDVVFVQGEGAPIPPDEYQSYLANSKNHDL